MKKNNENIEIIETSVEATVETENKKSFKDVMSCIGGFFKKIASVFKSDKIKNESLFKRGGYSLVITAIVLVGLIAFNWLVGVLGNRFHLEYDMTSNQKNSISEENIEYIKGIENEVNITVIGNEENFANYAAYYAQNHYNVTISSSSDYEYFEQTQTLISKYGEYNDKLNIKYVDQQSTEYAAIASSYSAYTFVCGDIIVDSSASGNKRTKILSFNDIYATKEDSTYAAYGYPSTYTLAANKLESALTRAISYVTSADTKKVAVLSGHSENSYTSAYIELLINNNYDITEIPDPLIAEISDEYDAIIISAPTIDFIGTELEVISEFLDNNGQLGKGLLFFADAASPYLPNLYDFLEQWGISVGEGIVFETYSRNIFGDTPTTLGTYPVQLEDDDITTSITGAITNYNVPMNVCEPADTSRTATALMQTLETTVAAPIGAAADWAEYTEDDIKQFDTVIQSVHSDRDSENNIITSYVMAFSSVEFIQSTWASYSDLSNQDIVMAVSDRAAHVGDTSITFTSKVIENESFASAVTPSSTKAISIIFMFVIPIAIVVIGIVVFVRRRNAR